MRWGSSPHVRGAPGGDGLECRGIGIIPACAGSTSPSRKRADSSQGSSPHVRGALALFFPDERKGGIIPACAGSTARHEV